MKAHLVGGLFKTAEPTSSKRLLGEAKVERPRAAMAQIFNAAMTCFGCKGANHALIGTSLTLRDS